MLQRLHRRERRQGKKLKEVARAWALGEILDAEQERRDQTEVDDALAAWGLVRESAAGPTSTGVLYLWPENLDSWALFHAVCTQWNFTEGRRTGLNYPGVEVLMRMSIDRPRRRELFADLQIMESAALAAWQEQQRANG